MPIVYTEFISSLRSELSNINLRFLDDDSWDDVTAIYDESHNELIRKCASFQIAKICATHSLSNPQKGLSFNLKIGKHKYHRAASQKYAAASTNFFDLYDDDDDDVDSSSSAEEEHWIISDESFALDDDEFDNSKIWHPADRKILTQMLKKVVEQRCKSHTYCLCRYVDTSFDHGRKHACSKGNPKYPQKVVHVMDDFVKAKKEFIPLGSYEKSPLHIEFHYKPHIQHLHVIGGLPFFHRRLHKKRYKVPWYEYSRYHRPQIRPSWLPVWMWHEIGAHTHTDPRKMQRMEADLRGQGLLGAQGANTAPLGVGGKHVHFRANEIDNNEIYDGYDDMLDALSMYYQYDEFEADKLDAMESDNDDDTKNAVDFIYPLMEKTAKYLAPVFECMFCCAFH